MKKRNGKKVSMEDLAGMVARGFSDVDTKFKKVDDQFQKIDDQFAKVDKQFEKVDENFKQVDENFKKIRNDILDIGDKFIPRHEFDTLEPV